MFRRFWRLLKSLQTAKRRGCPPSMVVLAVLTVVSVCNLRMFHRFWRFRRSRRLQIFIAVVVVFHLCYLTRPSSNPSSITTGGYHHGFSLSLKGSCHNGDANMLARVAMALITPSTVPCQVVSPLGKDLSREKAWREGGRCCAWRSTLIEVGD